MLMSDDGIFAHTHSLQKEKKRLLKQREILQLQGNS